MKYRQILPSGIVIASTEAGHAEQLEALQKLVFPHLADSERFKKAHYLKHLELFPEGQFVALDGAKLIGMTTTLRLAEKTVAENHTFAEVIEGGFCTSHDPCGEWLYGVDVGTHPEYRGLGIARGLYQARHAMCRALGIKGQYSMGMLNGFAAIKDRHTLEDYYASVVASVIFDPTVSMQMKLGFEPRGLVRNYLDDPTCGNAVVRLVLPSEKTIENGEKR